MSDVYNVLALAKGSERYVFLYDSESRIESLRTIARFASNPELSFTWYDAAVLSQKIRQSDTCEPVYEQLNVSSSAGHNNQDEPF